jgi:hypothetical protein
LTLGVALLRCDFFSDTLGLSTSVTVILPQPTTAQIGMTGSAGDEPPPVLYLLHGLSDDDTTWVRRTSIERYAAPLGLAVVMPAGHRSFYADEALGGAYWTFLTEELPSVGAPLLSGVEPAVRHVCRRAVDGRLRRFEVGAAAPGPGWRRPPHCPGRSTSPPSQPASTGPRTRTCSAGSSRMARSRRPTTFRSGVAADPTALPALWLGCGERDPVYDSNRRLAEACGAAGIDLTTSWVAGAEHDWALWDHEIQHVLDWLPIRRSAED